MTRTEVSEKRNGGYSLIELLVIIAIISVLLGFIGYNVSVTSSFKGRQCAKAIATDIGSLKVTTLSKSAVDGDTYMTIFVRGKEIVRKFYYKDGTTDEKVIGKRVNVSYVKGGSTVSLGEEGPGELKIVFKRSSGALYDLSTHAVSTVTEIRCGSGEKTYKVKLVPATGKVIQNKNI